MPSMASGKPRPNGVPGLTLCRNDHPVLRRSPQNVIPGSPGRRATSWFSRLRGRPRPRYRCGRSPPNQPTSDHADGATLVSWDAKASQLTRRPGIRDSVRNRDRDRGSDRDSGSDSDRGSHRASGSCGPGDGCGPGPGPGSDVTPPQRPNLVMTRTGWCLTA